MGRVLHGTALIMMAVGACMAQAPRTPDLAAQHAAMKKLDFLIGRWAGEARALRGPGPMIEMVQTEDVQYKVDGLVLAIEGMGRAKTDGKPVLQALALIAYDDERGVYRMRAFNDGRWLETDVKLLEGGTGMSWGFSFGDIKTSAVMRIDEKGEWTEDHELMVGSGPPRKLMEVAVRPQK